MNSKNRRCTGRRYRGGFLSSPSSCGALFHRKILEKSRGCAYAGIPVRVFHGQFDGSKVYSEDKSEVYRMYFSKDVHKRSPELEYVPNHLSENNKAG